MSYGPEEISATQLPSANQLPVEGRRVHSERDSSEGAEFDPSGASESSVFTQPLSEIEDEARRLLELGNASNISIRLLGGLAVLWHMPSASASIKPRTYKDIDFVTRKSEGKAVRHLLTAAGYDQDEELNSIQGHRRLLFYDSTHQRQIDVFVGQFEMCHKLPIAERLDSERHTIPLAELLLTKLQIFELNTKDQLDILNLLLYCDVGERDDGLINKRVVAELCARDWGLWRTVKLNRERTAQALASEGLNPEHRELIGTRLAELDQAIEEEGKSRAWKFRSKVGDRAQWYEQPEEVHP